MPRLPVFAVVGLLALIGAQAVRDKRGGGGPGSYLIEVDGVGSASAVSVDGGYLAGDVVTTPGTGVNSPQKQVGAVRVVPFTLEMAAGDLSNWITQYTGNNPQPVNGRVLELDYTYAVLSERAFNQARMTELVLPALDASSKEPARIKLTFQPADLQTKDGEGKKATVPGGGKDAKRAIVSNFRVTIPGIDCSGVTRVEPITIKAQLSNAATGAQLRVPPQVEGMLAGDLVLGVAEGKPGGFAQWADDFLKGNGEEKTVTVELLSPDLKSAVLTLEGTGVGIYALKPPAAGAATDKLRRAEAHLYVERWQVKPPK
jgi:hypothetical protein